MKTIENNKLIAEFMDWKDCGNYTYCNPSTNERHLDLNLLFNSSWDWLMPVIGKISNQCEEPEELDDLRMALLCNDIETAYKFVVDYLTE